MKVTLNPALLDDLRGTVASLSFSRLPASVIVRQPWTIRAPATPAQAAHRQAVAGSRTLWLSLDNSVRIAWDDRVVHLKWAAYATWNHYNVVPLRDGQLTQLTPPRPDYAPVSGVQFAAGGNGEIDATWAYSGPAATAYVELYHRKADTLAWVWAALCDADALADTLPDLEPGATYEVALTVHDDPVTTYQQAVHGSLAAGTVTFEDFTTYVELDPYELIDVTPYKIASDWFMPLEDHWVYDDKGPAHFGAYFLHHFDLTIDFLQMGVVFCPYSLSNVVDDAGHWHIFHEEAVGCHLTYNPPCALWTLHNYESGAFSGFEIIDSDVTYYCVAERTAPATLQLRIYSDEARTVLLDTLEVALNPARSYRYMFGIVSNMMSNANAVSFEFENLDLHES